MFELSSKWVVVGISFINIALAYGLNFSFSIFFVAILEEFKWSRAGIAGAFSLSSLIIGVGSWLGGKLVDHFGPRKILIGGSIILSLSTIASGLIQEIWHLYLTFGILAAIGTCSLGWVPNSVILSNWFVQNRGTMVGIAFSGDGIGIFILGPLAQYLISEFGWRTAYMLLGLVVLIVLLPLNCVQRNWPSQKDGPSKSDPSNQSIKVNDENKKAYNERNGRADWTLARAMKTLPFWSLFFSFFLIPLGMFPVIIHQVAYIIDQGYSKAVAASIFGVVGLLGSAGRPIFGALSDRMGREKAVTLSFISSITGILILLLLPTLKTAFWLYLYALFLGLSFGARSPIIAAMMADLYQGRYFGSIYGFIMIGNGVGGALGPWLAGYFHDLTGTYGISFLICIPMLMLACTLLWIPGRSVMKKGRDQKTLAYGKGMKRP
jgi:MFS family permease